MKKIEIIKSFEYIQNEFIKEKGSSCRSSHNNPSVRKTFKPANKWKFDFVENQEEYIQTVRSSENENQMMTKFNSTESREEDLEEMKNNINENVNINYYFL